MRVLRVIAISTAWLAATAVGARAQDKPSLHEINGFMVKGAFTELDPELMKHRLSLKEIERDGLDGRAVPVADLLQKTAAYEKMRAKVAEPLEVRGNISVALTPNTRGDEAFTTCFLAFTYNGLALSGISSELTLVRPETRQDLAPPRRRWNRDRILAARLFRLGYLSPDPILRKYRDEIGTREGHVVLEPKSNVAIVIDQATAIDELGSLVDAEILAAMGTSPGQAGLNGVQVPSAGAMVSRDCIHFYLLAFARTNRIAMAAEQQPGTATKYYPEADLWLGQRGFEALQQEYRRINNLFPLAKEAFAQGWVDPRPERTLSPSAQRRLEIRFGLVSPEPRGDRARTAKKAVRKKR